MKDEKRYPLRLNQAGRVSVYTRTLFPSEYDAHCYQGETANVGQGDGDGRTCVGFIYGNGNRSASPVNMANQIAKEAVFVRLEGEQ